MFTVVNFTRIPYQSSVFTFSRLRHRPTRRSNTGTVSKRKDEIVPTSTNAVDLFRIECTSDIVIGDTILFTERVMGFIPEDLGSRRRSRKVKEINKSHRQVVGEQTVCAMVTRERWSRASITKRSSRKGNQTSSYPLEELSSSRGVKSSSTKSSLPDRSLCLRVLWSTASTPAASKELAAPNTLIWRQERKLCHYEMHRIEWVDEESRLPYANQWEEYFSSFGDAIESKKSVQGVMEEED